MLKMNQLSDELLERHHVLVTTDKPKGRALAGKASSYPFSGILRCGECGAPMVIAGGSSTKYYRCGDAKKRGTSRTSCRSAKTSRAHAC